MKPRITKGGRWWRCEQARSPIRWTGSIASWTFPIMGWGLTPAQAYDDWKNQVTPRKLAIEPLWVGRIMKNLPKIIDDRMV